MSGYFKLEKEYFKIEYKRVFTESDRYKIGLGEFIERADVEMYKNKVVLKKQIVNTIK
jgi:hypothetical protein